MKRIKISTINVQSGVGITKGYWQYLTSSWKYFLPHSQKYVMEIADFINLENIDIITLTEIDGGSFRTKNIDYVKLLSDNTSLNEHVFYSAYQLKGVLNQGNAILTKYPIIESKKYRLPGKGEPRYLGVALSKVNDRDVSILVAHLSLSKQIRAKQIHDISEVVNNITTPLILSGDFNVSDESELAIFNDIGLKRITDYMAYPSWKPKSCKDFIFVTDHFIIKSYYIPKMKISDHLSVVIETAFN